MEDIQDNEYIRTQNGTITKISEVEIELCMNSLGQVLYKNWILGQRFYEVVVKHSFDIKDLIKPMDFVNGMQVDEFDDVEGNLYLGFPIYDDGLMNSISEFRPLDTVEIETILTYEQYNSNCYRLEE